MEDELGKRRWTPIEHTCDGTNKTRCRCKRERDTISQRERRRLAPPRTEESRRTHLRYTYGLTVEDVEAMRVEQDYRCALCGVHEADVPLTPRGRPRLDGRTTLPAMPLFIDHCHASGRVRALLCHRCNYALGIYADDPGRLRAAADYIDRYRPDTA